MKKNRTVVFLDFDGTTIPLLYEKTLLQLAAFSKNALKSGDKYGMYFHPNCMDNIKRLVDKYQVDIVVTSTWKNTLGLEGLQEMWVDRAYPGRIIGITPKGADLNKRGLEIQNYLNANPNITKYVIIDDMGDAFYEKSQLPYLVQCDPDLGFTEVKQREACRVLG